MPFGPSSWAKDCVSPITAAFDVLYALMFAPPLRAAIEAILTIDPPSRRYFEASLDALYCARTFTSSILLTNSSVTFSIGPVVGKIPALFTIKSIPC